MMINPNHENRSVSSIDLLQERFRQLQKMKELRQEKELLRILSESADRSSSSSSYGSQPPIITHDDKYYLSAAAMKLLPANNNKPTTTRVINNDCQLSLSLWPADSPYIAKRAADNQSNVGHLSKSSCFADAMFIRLESSGAGSDVDTSLRL
ncbi:hypothetical protein ABFS82_13G134800 [Erythranthe guttata]|uniref:Uncharacterized protein n=1 Tax=Erythranthe guttata TaxID=4155 RepID=A0A022QMF9_ERYGU|nr:hypothetical protein MIMGU_mgv1a027020mg [Erythranthe guttata]